MKSMAGFRLMSRRSKTKRKDTKQLRLARQFGMPQGPLPTATVHFEAEELLALMWAVETASDPHRQAFDAEGEAEPAGYAMEVHQRLQSAWQEIRGGFK